MESPEEKPSNEKDLQSYGPGNQQDDTGLDSLEGPDTKTSSPASLDGNAEGAGPSATKNETPLPTQSRKKESLVQRVQHFITKINIYLLLFILVIVLAAAIVFISLQRNRSELAQKELETQELTADELREISGSDTKIGDPKQTLTIASNAIFSGQALIEGNLDVAGEIKVGSGLNVPGVTVSGDSTLGQVAANGLTVANDASIQGQFNVQENLTVAGSGSFGGPLSAPQLTVGSFHLDGDLVLRRHIDSTGGTPGKSNGPALGGGGTSSINGTDTAGTISINTGSGAGAGCFATINFTNSYNGTPHVVVSPVGSAAASINYYVNRGGGSFSICTATPPPSGASFAFDYIVIN